eukprot:1189274-Prorocentrum_minimum.AAC.1
MSSDKYANFSIPIASKRTYHNGRRSVSNVLELAWLAYRVQTLEKTTLPLKCTMKKETRTSNNRTICCFD